MLQDYNKLLIEKIMCRIYVLSYLLIFILEICKYMNRTESNQIRFDSDLNFYDSNLNYSNYRSIFIICFYI